MKEHPILFNGEMVRALLSGAKTQTRRVLKPQPQGTGPGGCPLPIIAAYRIGDGWDFQSADGATQAVVCCPYGVPGDRLWVRETFAPDRLWRPGEPLSVGESIVYQADQSQLREEHRYIGRWKPSIHMPRWASRITLEVTDVRVERVQDISDYDCHCEGVAPPVQQQFQQLWDSINAKRGYGFAANPWVYAVTFKVVT